MLTTTHSELAASIECRVGLKQFGPQSGGSVGVGVGVGEEVGVGAAVGVVNPGGSPIAVGVGVAATVGVGDGVWAKAVEVKNVPRTANTTRAAITHLR